MPILGNETKTFPAEHPTLATTIFMATEEPILLAYLFNYKSQIMEINVFQTKIHEIRGVKVIFDFDLAALYEVETKVLNQAVKRNIIRFPEDFMFQLTLSEWDRNSSQFVTSSSKYRESKIYECTNLKIWKCT